MNRRNCALAFCLLGCALGMASNPLTIKTKVSDSDKKDSEEREEHVMQEISVTAMRRLSDTGLEKTVLDTTKLHQNISLSMGDVLTRHSSLFIKQYGRATEATAEFRGTSPNHTQVLWNGMRINSPMLGTVDFSTIPAYFVDEASLLHGASSLTKTSGGLGGAIDLHTLPTFDQGWGLQYVQGVGSYRTFDQFLRLTYSNERWSSSTRLVYGTSQNNFRYTNYDKMVDVCDEWGNITNSYHPKERNKSGYFDDAHLMQDLHYNDGHGNRLSATLWYTQSLRGLPFLSVDYKDNSDFRNEQRLGTLRSVLSWRHTGSCWNTTLEGGVIHQNVKYDYTTRRQLQNTAITHSRTRSHTAYLQATADWMPAPQWLLTAMSNVYFNHVHSADKSPFHQGDNYIRSRAEEAVSLSAKWRPTSRLSLSALLRTEFCGRPFQSTSASKSESTSKSKAPLIPALFADVQLYRPWGLVLKASVARNLRHPSLDDLYFQPGGNPDLQPERGFTYDAGLEMARKTRRYELKGNLTAFDSRISDWILWTPNAKGFWQPANVKKVHNYGFEAHAESSVKLPRQWEISFSGNLSYTPSINQSEGTGASDQSRGKQLCYVPRWSANLQGQIQWRQWALTYQWTHYSERFTTTSNDVSRITGRLLPYYMSDVMLERRFQWRHMHASLKAAVQNLLGTEYVTVLSRPMAGRNFEIFLELKPQWKKK